MAFKFQAKKATREQVYTKVAIMGPSGCVDADTEFFNGFGWKRIADYEDGEKVLEYDERTRMAILSIPIQYHKYPCDSLWHFRTKYGLDQCLSDEHNVAYITSKGNFAKKPFLEVRLAHEANKYGFEGGFITAFNYSGNGIDLTDEEIELMCAVICDGSFQNNGTRCRFHIKKDRKKKKLKDIFSRCNLEYLETESTTEGYTDFFVNVPRNEKVFSSYWYNCNQHQLQIICNNVTFWDGNENYTRNGKKRLRFSTSQKETADFIQFAFSACGMRATISTNDRIGQEYLTNGKFYIRKSVEYNVTISPRTIVTMAGNCKCEIERYVPYDGFKYCFTMPTSNLILRRGDRIFVTGNSGKSYSALRLATGMAEELSKTLGRPAKILMGNTEASRGRYYANEFTYDIVDLEAPYNPEMFVDFINYAVEEGYDILVLDTTSPEWEGKGGCLELHQAAGGKYQDWAKVA